MGKIGGSGWEHGPLLIGDEALRRSYQRRLTRDEALELAGVEDKARVTSLAGQPAVLLAGGSPTDVARLDDKSAVFVRFVKRGKARLSSLDDVSPWWVDDDGWIGCEHSLSVQGDVQAFDLAAQVAAKSAPDEAEDYGDYEGQDDRGEQYLSVALEPGEYLVEWAALKVPTGDELGFVRLRQLGHEPVRPDDVIPIPQRKRLECSAETIELAKTLTFIGHGDGGPTVILPNAVRERWKGVSSGQGEEGTHYELACDSNETFEFSGLDAFCLQEDGSTAVLPVNEGMLFPRWVGADSGAAVLAVALQAKYQPVLREDEPLFFESRGGRFTLMHAVEDGSAPEAWAWESIEFEIPAGKYAVEQMDVDDHVEWKGVVVFPDGTSEDSMVRAYRLRLL